MTNNSKDDGSLEDYFLAEIEKSGYPLEIHVSSILEGKDWIVMNNQPFRDPDHDELRSIDILAFHHPTASNFKKHEPLAFSPRLVIECKKSTSHAWVFFTRPEKMNVFPMSGHIYDFPKAFSTQAYKDRKSLLPYGLFSYEYYFNSFAYPKKGIRRIHYADFDKIAITYDEYKIRKRKGGDSRNDILGAISQTVKFVTFDLEESISSPGRIRSATSPYFPVEFNFISIVFDGKLYEASLEGDKPSIKKKDHILHHHLYRPTGSFVNFDFWIDIIQKEFFPDYLAKIHQDISIISDKIVAERKTISTYLRKDITA